MTDRDDAATGESASRRWSPDVDPERRKRPRRISDERAVLRRLTAGAVVTATGLGVALFAQAAESTTGSGDVQSAIVSVIGALFPGAGLRPASSSPSPAPPGTAPVATTHPS